MLTQNLSSYFQGQRIANATAAGVTVVNTASVDTAGFRGVTFLTLLGAVLATGVVNVKAQQSDDDGVGDDFSDVAGSGQTVTDVAASNKVIQLEVHKPTKRFVRLAITRTVANSAVDAVVAMPHTPTFSPTPLHSTCAARKILNAPPEGTA